MATDKSLLLPRPVWAEDMKGRNPPPITSPFGHHLAWNGGGYRRVEGARAIYWDNRMRLGKDDRPWCILQATLDGEGFFGEPQGNQPLRTGQVFLVPVPSPTSYGLHPGKSWEWTWITFSGDLGFQLVDEINRAAGFVVTVPQNHPFWQALATFPMPRSGYPVQSADLAECSAAAYRLLLLLGTAINHPERSSDPRVTRVLQVIDECFDDPTLSGEDLAAASGLSKFHFLRLFRKATGRTPGQVLRNRRLTEARRLLAESGQSVKEIAYATGYSSPVSFCAAFRREYGVTPGSLQQRV